MKGEAFSWILAAISLLTYFFETYKQNKDDKLTEEYYDFRPEGGGGGELAKIIITTCSLLFHYFPPNV